MEEYNVSDYGIFSSAISTAKTLNTKIDEMTTAVKDCQNKISDASIFMGPACDSCNAALTSSGSKLSSLGSNFKTMSSYLAEVANNYQAGDQSAADKILSVDSAGSLSVGTKSTSLTGNSNQDQIYNYLSEQGFNQAVICGILANIKRESNYNPTALGDNGTSYGICQWHNTRWDSLKAYCEENNLDSNTLEGQLPYLMHELERYSELSATLKSLPDTAEGAYQAAYEWTIKYERPAGMYTSAESRGNIAKEMYESYSNSV